MEVDVAWLDPDGSGGGRDAEGRRVRARGALPGERVRLLDVALSAKEARAREVEVLRASPDRVSPTCPQDAACGGCDLSHVRSDARRALLAGVVARGFSLPEPPAVVPSPRATGHRARIKLALTPGAVGYRGHRSHDLVDTSSCQAAREEVQASLTRFREWWSAHADPALTEVELRSDGAQVAFALRSDGPVPRAARDALEALGDVALDGRALHGDPTRRLQVHGVTLEAGPDAFYQVNLEGNHGLVAHVLDTLRAHAPERALDLYAGIGNFGLPLAASGVPVVAVERSGQALSGLRAVAQRAGWPVKALALPAERFDASREPFDAAVLDPPRAGAGEVLSRVLRSRPRVVVLVSCDVRAGAADVRRATSAGYRIADVTAFDLFPDTHHIEVVTTLTRA